MHDDRPAKQSEIQGLVTVGDFIRWSQHRFTNAGLFFGHGTDNALDEAAALVLHSLQMPYELPASELAAKVDEAGRARILKLMERRIDERKSLAYLTHETVFAGHAFYVDERVLVPRSPIAELIDEQFRPWLDPSRVSRILDLCTGSGCIAIGCASVFPHADVDATDVSHDALAVAEVNINKHDVGHRVRAIESDLYGRLDVRNYDLIVSNPPYVNGAELDRLPEEFRAEPNLGFDGGASGIDCIVRILAGAADYLSELGIFGCRDRL